MKVNCASTIQIVSTKPYSPNDVIKIMRAVVGKKAAIDVADTAMGVDLVAAARAAFAVDPTIAVAKTVLVFNDVEVDDNKTLSALGIKNGSSVQIRYVVNF